MSVGPGDNSRDNDRNNDKDVKEPADLLRDGGSSSTPNEYGGNHEVIYDKDRGQHISWDAYRDGTYAHKSGHTRDDRSHKTISDWDK